MYMKSYAIALAFNESFNYHACFNITAFSNLLPVDKSYTITYSYLVVHETNNYIIYNWHQMSDLVVYIMGHYWH